jgi:hypothetical protein
MTMTFFMSGLMIMLLYNKYRMGSDWEQSVQQLCCSLQSIVVKFEKKSSHVVTKNSTVP